MSQIIFLFLSFLFFSGNAVFEKFEWEGSWPPGVLRHKCVPIPTEMDLCQNVGYSTMRLPNLLEHDSIEEVIKQSSYWRAILLRECHPETQRFLCSIYAPICIEDSPEPIQPCRSLCESVKKGCESSIRGFGYGWPSILNCSKFPAPGDLCIELTEIKDSNSLRRPLQELTKNTLPPVPTTTAFTSLILDKSEKKCRKCPEVTPSSKLVRRFCRSDLVLKGKVEYLASGRYRLKKQRKIKVYRNTHPNFNVRKNVDTIKFSAKRSKCSCQVSTRISNRKQVVFIQFKSQGGLLLAMEPWISRTKVLMSTLKKIKCPADSISSVQLPLKVPKKRSRRKGNRRLNNFSAKEKCGKKCRKRKRSRNKLEKGLTS